MFWNDPILYGATLPYRDINVQQPFMGTMPWQNFQTAPKFPPQFAPQFYGFQPPIQHIPQMGVNPFLPPQAPVQHIPQMGVNPFLPTQVPQMFNPYLQTQGINPFVPFNVNLPQYNWCRPLTF